MAEPALFCVGAATASKRCPRCKEHLPLDSFYRLARAKDGRQTYCKSCQAAVTRKYEERNAEVLRLRRAERLARTPDSVGVKKCRKCGETKPMLSFYAHRGTKDHRANYCMECQKAATRQWRLDNAERARCQYTSRTPDARRRNNRKSLLKMYGLTEEDYARFLIDQGGVCAICRCVEIVRDARTGEPRRLAVDHCHATGDVRGLLCVACNRVLGLVNDDPARLQSAITYLESRVGKA